MNHPLTMFVVCLSGILLMYPSSDAVKLRICRTRDLVSAYVRICPRSLQEEETVAHGVDVEGPSKSERTLQKSRYTSDTEEEDEPGSLAALVDLLLDMDSRRSAVEELTDDDQSLASAGEGLSGRGGGMVGERRRRRSVTKKGRVYKLLRLCCIHGCTDKDIKNGICAEEAEPTL